MNLGIIVHRGGSLENWKEFGQDKRVVDYYLKNYAKAFDKVYMFSYADANMRADLPKNVTIVPNMRRIPFSLYALLIPLIHRKMIRECDVFRVFHPSGGLTAVITKLLFGKRYVMTYGYMWLDFLRFNGKRLQYVIAMPTERLGFRFADRIIVTIKETWDYVKGFIPENKLVKIPNGVDTNIFKPMPRMHKAGRKRIISVGRLTKQKNYDNLIKAISVLGFDAELVLYGEGEEKAYLSEVAKKFGCRLIFGGMIPNEFLPQEIAKADVFALPSFMEGMPKALIEAMACGIPCVAADIPTIREVVRDGETGLLCGHDVDSIKEMIEWVLKNEAEAREIGKRGRLYAVGNFSIDKLMQKEIKLLKLVADNTL